ncbi:putative tRNA pseudouridine synthase Pus10 [Binucleata daphniae]
MSLDDAVAYFRNFTNKNYYKAKKYVFADFVKSDESEIIKFELKKYLKNDNDISYVEIVCEIRNDSKNEINENVNNVTRCNDEFCLTFKLTNNLYLRSTIKNSTIYIYGLYEKMSRNMSQTPMRIKGKLKYDRSVSDFADEFKTYFDAKDVVFIPAGREDSDVRCFGRPFILKIIEPKTNISDYDNIKCAIKCTLNKQKLTLKIDNMTNNEYTTNANMNIEINNDDTPCNNARDVDVALHNDNNITNTINVMCDGDVTLRNLCVVKKEVKKHIFSGETKAKKTYRAFVYTNGVIKQDLANTYTIKQKTPLRVLHRRANLERTRLVEITNIMEQDGMYVLTLYADAGAYIKEFVNGDFGRTIPSISSLVGEYCDCVYLDVLAIDTEPLKEEWIIHKIT